MNQKLASDQEDPDHHHLVDSRFQDITRIGGIKVLTAIG